MSIYITGDCNGDYRRFSTEIFPEQYTMGKSDYVIAVSYTHLDVYKRQPLLCWEWRKISFGRKWRLRW